MGRRTIVGQSRVEASPSLVETLVCYSQPLDLVGQHLVAVLAQEPVVNGIDLFWILVYVPYLARGVLDNVDGKAGALHSFWGIRPPRATFRGGGPGG